VRLMEDLCNNEDREAEDGG